MTGSVAQTRGIEVRVRSVYLPEHSDPANRQFLFAYTIRISNGSDEDVQLLSRHWIIRDGDGGVEEVQGPGVVGVQPRLKPGEAFEYSSFCPLGTPVGSMEGTYQMVSHTRGDQFDVLIAPFTLSEPYAFH